MESACLANCVRPCLVALAVMSVHSTMSPSSTALEAQGAPRREVFDAASIKRAPTTSISMMMRDEPSGLTATSMTALYLITFAYGVLERDVVGELPAWVKTTRFDVVARTADGPLTPRRLLAMTRALLEDRFRLDASYEQKSGRVLALVRERPEVEPTPSLRPSESKCRVDAPLEARTTPGLGDRCGAGMMWSGTVVAVYGSRVTMREVAAALSRNGGYDRPIVDRTGLPGEFDVSVMANGDIVAPTRQARLLIALREQVGLTLRSEEGTYEVLRIRGIEQPSAN